MGFNWQRAEAWRHHPLLTGTWRHSMPGLGIGLVAFAAYVAYDQTVGKSKDKAGHH
jgi:NADH dehydrogenase (ubiquinone) 1 beta subcomplex subunit 3